MSDQAVTLILAGMLTVVASAFIVAEVFAKRHRHQWVTLAVDYTPPQTRSVDVEGPAYRDLVKKAVLGLTVVSLRCTECGDVSSREFVGRWNEAATADAGGSKGHD